MPIDPSQPLIDIQAGQPQDGGLTGSSWMQYGSILLTDVLTEAYEMNEVRTQDNAQVLSIHHVIKVTGIINPNVNSFVQLGEQDSPHYGTVSNSAPVRGTPQLGMMQNIYLLKNWLLQDRQALDWSVGGIIVLQSPQYRTDNPTQRFSCDSNHGPHPLYCQITHITGTGSFFVRFGIETWVDACANDFNKIHAHRFSMAHDVDGDTWLTTRHVTGQIKFRPEVIGANINLNPDQVIRIWAHPVPRGFKRQNVKIQALSNGMEFAYSFVDVEQTLPLGSLSPATKLSAEFTIVSSFADGKPAAGTMASVHVTAVGPKNQFRQNLMTMAVKIALRKLQKPGLISVNAFQVTYSLDNTLVDIRMQAVWAMVAIGPGGVHLPMAGLLAADDKDDLDAALSDFRAAGEAAQGTQNWLAKAPKLRNYGTVGTYLGILVASSIVNGCFTPPDALTNWYTPTDNNGNVPLWGETVADDTTAALIDAEGNAVPYSFENVTSFTLQLLDTGIDVLATASTGVYEDWQMDTRYYTNHQRAILPIGATQAASPGDELTFVPPQVGTLGFPYTLKCVNWSVAWIGPSRDGIILPGPDDDTNDTLIAEDITPAVPSIASSTMKTWRISGTYWYLTDKLVTASALEKANFDYTDGGIPMGGNITDPYDQSDNTINQSKFTAGYSPSFV